MANSNRDFSDVDIESVYNFLSERDPVMRDLIGAVGGCDHNPGGDHYQTLIESMIYQQVTGKAAEAIYSKFLNRCGGSVTPETVSSLNLDQMRGAGLSRQKISYIMDLTEKVLNGDLQLDGIDSLADEEIVERLVTVKGIGTWTAQMFLIFTLGRIDVFPLNDLGVRKAIQKRYGNGRKISERRMEKIASRWEPYRTVGVLILWKSENMKLPTS